MKKKEYDFSGWATRNNIRCSDGRVIKKDAFIHQDGEIVPLVWNHQAIQTPENILGHALLKNKDEGVYAYCSFNDNPRAQDAKRALKHGDITQLSIWAKHLRQRGSDVMHGVINEVSLVLRGANPGAYIDSESFAHSDNFIESYDGEFDDDGIIYTGMPIDFYHSDDNKKKKNMNDDDDDDDEDDAENENDDDDVKNTKKKKKEELNHSDGSIKSIQQIFDTLSDEQKDAVYAIVGSLVEDDENEEARHSDNNLEENKMKHNIFDVVNQNGEQEFLSHADQEDIIKNAKESRMSLRQAWEDYAFQHSDDDDGPYGIQDIEWLFPEYKNLNTPPEFLKRETDWVNVVMNGVHKTPFSRIKSMQADIREDEARAKGYMKGNRKTEEVFSLLKRTTDPQTIYKKQKLDRDDIIDITDFDVVSWIKAEMRMMLEEEIARSILVGDGRLASSDDKIHENHVRSILADDELYSVKVPIKIPANADDDTRARAYIRGIIKSRKNYKGSGTPKLFTTEDYLTDMLLIEDSTGRIIYDSPEKLKNTLRVSDIQTVPVMENMTFSYKAPGDQSASNYDVVGIIVNLSDYNVGADKGGAVSMFEDFDIDYNQEKYLIETRISGALIKPFSALVILAKSGS